MSEIPRYEVPQYTKEEVINPERETALTPIDEAQVMDVENLVGNRFQQFQNETLANKALSWEQKLVRMKKIASEQLATKDYELSEQEEEIIMAFWGIGEMLQQMAQRTKLLRDLEDIKYENEYAEEPDYAKEDEIIQEMDRLNIESADWQMSVMKMVLALRETKTGQAFIEKFWQTFEGLADQHRADGKREARYLKNGILGMVTSIDVLEALDVKTYFAFPDQDACQKIDLWGGVKDGQIIAFQIKSHYVSGNLRVYGEEITAKEDTRHVQGQDKREVTSRNILFTSGGKYAKLWGVPFIGTVWMDLDHYGGISIIQNDNDGRPRIPPDLPQSKLAETLDTVVAKGGRSAKH